MTAILMARFLFCVPASVIDRYVWGPDYKWSMAFNVDSSKRWSNATPCGKCLSESDNCSYELHTKHSTCTERAWGFVLLLLVDFVSTQPFSSFLLHEAQRLHFVRTGQWTQLDLLAEWYGTGMNPVSFLEGRSEEKTFNRPFSGPTRHLQARPVFFFFF